MKKLLSGLAVLTVTGIASAQAPPNKIAVIYIQQALVATKEGQKASAELQARFEPRRKEIEGKQSELAVLQKDLSQGANTMAEAKRVSLQRDIDSKTKALQRTSQDAQDEFEQERNRVLNDLGQRMMVVLDKYARDNGYAVVIDVSSEQTPVLWAATGINITQDIVDLYDKNAPAAAATKPAAPGAPAVAPVKPAPPAAPPATKKK